MKAIVLERFGAPAEALHVRDVPVPEPGRGQVRVRMLLAPVNPSDVMVVRGQYGRLPTLPATPGFEGVGVIDKVGWGLLAKLRGLKPGRRVATLTGPAGSWQQHVVIPARAAVPVPDDLPDEQVATFFVNPATALVMTRRVLQIPSKAWLLQTAAGSALGRMIIRLGKHAGFRTINVVRRRELVSELQALGADHVLVSTEEDVAARVREITGGAGVPFAIDPVGGTSGRDCIRSLAPKGRLLLYGTLANEPIPLESRTLMVGQKRIEGFWLSEWVQAQGVLTMLSLFREITALLRANVLTTSACATFAMEQIHDALRLAEQAGKPGKVLLRLGEGLGKPEAVAIPSAGQPNAS